AAAPADKEVPRPAGIELPRGAKVVVVEDNDDSREMLCALLTRAGFECKSSENGSAGLALIEDFTPVAAVVDIGLPEIDGLELARRIRKNPEQPDIYLVALTGYGQQGDRQTALEAGFDEHLVKPVDFAALLNLLGRGRRTGHSSEVASEGMTSSGHG
ncbi:MAG TPA: response regulator, partial [Polyangiaceae bacterium]